MPSWVVVELDTTGPQGVAVAVNGGAAKTAVRDVSVAISSTSPDATQVVIYGDVDGAANPNIQPLEANSTPIALASPHTVRLSNGDGAKTVRVKVVDDVGNRSAEASDAITLDTVLPAVTTQPPTRAKVSSKAGFDATSFDWSPDDVIEQYEVHVVPTTGANRGAGTLIGNGGGSQNVSGGAVAAAAVVTTTVKSADLKAASAADGSKTIKVFVFADGQWSSV